MLARNVVLALILLTPLALAIETTRITLDKMRAKSARAQFVASFALNGLAAGSQIACRK